MTQLEYFEKLYNEATRAQHPEMLRTQALLSTPLFDMTNYAAAAVTAAYLLNFREDFDEKIGHIKATGPAAKRYREIPQPICPYCGGTECYYLIMMIQQEKIAQIVQTIPEKEN